MGSLLLQQIPLALGIIMSPLAVVAVVAVLFSERARINSIAYLIGWYLGIVVALAGAYMPCSEKVSLGIALAAMVTPQSPRVPSPLCSVPSR